MRLLNYAPDINFSLSFLLFSQMQQILNISLRSLDRGKFQM